MRQWARQLAKILLAIGVLVGAHYALTGIDRAVSGPVRITGRAGEYGMAEGIVAQVHVDATSRITFLDMGGRYPYQQFTAVIFPEDAHKFPDVETLGGRPVRITGPLRDYQGIPEIVLRSASQIRTL